MFKLLRFPRLGHPFSWRDMMLILIGASFMHLLTVFYPIRDGTMGLFKTELGMGAAVIQINTHVHSGQSEVVGEGDLSHHEPGIGLEEKEAGIIADPAEKLSETSEAQEVQKFPATSVIHHAPGYTLFRNLYMSNGTLYILTDQSSSSSSSFPPVRMMASVSIFADGSAENIAAREPTREVMDFISLEEARRRWQDGRTDDYRVFEVEGNTVLFNDPSQFLNHYYHFVAELWFGVQAFWHGAFSEVIEETVPAWPIPDNWNWNAYPMETQSSHPSIYNHPPTHNHNTSSAIPPIHRSIFMHTSANGWRDVPGFNSFFIRAAFPSMTIEHQEDWDDRVSATRVSAHAKNKERAFLFPLVLLVDRSAAFRDEMTGSHTQRTAAQAWEYMRSHGKLRGEKVGGWWEPVRSAVLRFIGIRDRTGGAKYVASTSASGSPSLSSPEKILITYISRQSGLRRKLTRASHEGLVSALEEFVERRNAVRGTQDQKPKFEFELIVMEAEKLTKDEQLEIISRTTILLGPHGNGLTHLVFLPPTSLSTVIEIFYPGGFAHDYHWTSRALGMRWVGIWNDTSFTYPNEPEVAYPQGFQEDYIPVYGPAVVKAIEDIVDSVQESSQSF
ncbi:hypothetical protein F5880DRAFT_1211137 [Lentinula raphanica]|nr:hypothetical protein F5880DRAFT_1211137 [Lentinula raphanica]